MAYSSCCLQLHNFPLGFLHSFMINLSLCMLSFLYILLSAFQALDIVLGSEDSEGTRNLNFLFFQCICLNSTAQNVFLTNVENVHINSKVYKCSLYAHLSSRKKYFFILYVLHTYVSMHSYLPGRNVSLFCMYRKQHKSVLRHVLF